MKDYYIDLHCHPSLKPYGKSFNFKNRKRKNTSNVRRSNSIWHCKQHGFFGKLVNILLGATKFTQADFRNVGVGEGKVLMVSLYPMEKGMVTDLRVEKHVGTTLTNFATGIGRKRIRHLQKMKDYFTDLEHEYNFVKEKKDVVITTDGRKRQYKLVRNFNEIVNDDTSLGIDTIYVIITIEGCHVFNCGLELAGKPVANETEVLGNIQKVKNWEFPPFFVGLAHHFFNELCGQARSVEDIARKFIRQDDKEHINDGILNLGNKVIDSLLDKTNGKRIYIDIKHMNIKSREDYYSLIIDGKYKNEDIPIIISHGAVIGQDNSNDKNSTAKHKFTDGDINFYDDEILKIEQSNGVFGVQLDERRIVPDSERGFLKNLFKQKRKLLRKGSKFIWNQIEHIATVLDEKGENAWDIQCLGTDFDGIVDPLDGWWSSRELRFLDIYLENHAIKFLNSERGSKLKSENKLSAEEIIAKFMYLNAEAFMQKYFV
jgi:microsomal dipeptidase-like Zn-dependent dipeptidase